MADRAQAKSRAQSRKKGSMKGMSVKSGDKRPTEDGAGLTPQGAKKAGVKTAVTTDPSELDPNGKAAKNVVKPSVLDQRVGTENEVKLLENAGTATTDHGSRF